MKQVRTSTRALVATLDLRGFALDVPRLSVEFGDVDVDQTLRVLPSTFPWLRYILLDGHREVDAGFLAVPLEVGAFRAPGFEAPLVLSVPCCKTKKPTAFFGSPYLTSLVYLDISNVRGSIKNSIFQRKISPRNLPRLRILKARSRGLDLDDTTTYVLLESFKTQLWSLDLSGNKITSELLPELVNLSFPPLSIRAGVARFNVEGILSFESSGHNSYGKHAFIQESQWSGNFSHPQRHLADAPVYTRNATQERPQGGTGVRSDGRVKTRPDSADAVVRLLANGLHTVPVEHVYDLDICRDRGGVTHLYLNNTDISARGLARLIRESPGQLERLECNAPIVEIPSKGPSDPALPPWFGKKPRLSGAVGIAHLFRPIWSSNLQVLRIHHSLVTHVLTLTQTGLPAMENIWLAETYLLPRAVLAYPQAFVPDMNPRLRSLILTQIPRFSTGCLIDKLIGLLKLASIQERAIQDATKEASTTARHGPSMLLGLRHIHLQFEPSPQPEHPINPQEDNINIEDFGLSEEDFSFFTNDSGGGWGVSSGSSLSPSTRKTSDSTQHFEQQRQQSQDGVFSQSHSSPFPQPQRQKPQPHESDRLTPGKLTTYPYSETTDEYLPHICTWNGVEYALPIWIGDGIIRSQHPGHAIDEYMRNLGYPKALIRIEPANPSHVLAGVPEGAFIFSDAWDAILSPFTSHSRNGTGGVVRPMNTQLDEMRDVLGAIKEYRAQTRTAFEEEERKAREVSGGDGDRKAQVPLGEPHYYYTGRVEISIEDTTSGGGGGERRG